LIEDNRILLVINNDESVKYLMECLIIRGGYSVSVEQSEALALEAVKENNFALIIVDLVSGEQEISSLLKGVMEINEDIVVFGYTEKVSAEIYQQAANLGFFDLIVKPIDFERLFFAVRRGFYLHNCFVVHRRQQMIFKEQNSSLQKQNILLAKRTEDFTKNLARLQEDLRSTYFRTIRALAQAIDARDHYTHSHSQNVAKYSVLIAQQMKLSVKELEGIREAAELHDIGKIGISDSILIKTSSLTPEEWGLIKIHPLTGAQILAPLTFLSDVIEIVKEHHEHYDGTGYPAGIKNDEILLGARIIHLSDAYDSMISARSYRQMPYSQKEAVDEIKDKSGTQFDPVVVQAFLEVLESGWL